MQRYGGIDSVLVWPTYPQLGVDDRNQFAMIAALPGGLAGLKQVGDELHARGVKALWPFNPWDDGTHHDRTQNWRLWTADSLADTIAATDFDGFFGDCMGGNNNRFLVV